MSSLKTSCLVLGLCCAAQVAKAQSIDNVTMTSDPDDVVFTLHADKPLGESSVHSYKGSVRVRFADSDSVVMQKPGDGAAIERVDVRPGSHGSAVMRLDFGDSTKLSASDVRIEPRKQGVVVRIARDLLPPMQEPEPVVEPKKSESAEVAQPDPASPAELVATPKAEAVPKPLAKKAELPTALQKPKTPLAAAMTESRESSPVPMLITVSVILAIAYLSLRLVMKQKQKAPRAPAPIDIVAQKRIGPRHQLLIVRAFGREHLLSVQGGTTTPIATSDETEESFGQALKEASRVEPSPELMHGVAITQRTPEAPREPKVEVAPGTDIIRAALAQRLSAAAREQAQGGESAPAEAPRKGGEDKALSKAVAGLVRLRREARL